MRIHMANADVGIAWLNLVVLPRASDVYNLEYCEITPFTILSLITH